MVGTAHGRNVVIRSGGRIALALLAVLFACTGLDRPQEAGRSGSNGSGTAIEVVDDAGRLVRLERAASRVVSLLPATTDLLVALGAADRLVARTEYDDDHALAHLPSVGGGLTPSLEQIASLRPDLVIAWEEAGGARLRPRLEALEIPVFAARTRDTTAIFANVERLGALLGLEGRADSLAGAMRAELAAVRESVAGRPRPRALYLISLDPPIIAGRSLFIGELLEIAGGDNVFSDLTGASPQVSLEEVLRRRPAVVLVASDASGVRADIGGRPGWRELVEGGTRFRFVTADSVHRPGPRIGHSARLLRMLLHDDPEEPR